MTWPGEKGFVGGTQDRTGLTHIGARQYDPVIGRFISLDPVMDQDDPQSMQGYAYANNNPTSFSDPDGKALIGDSGGEYRAYRKYKYYKKRGGGYTKRKAGYKIRDWRAKKRNKVAKKRAAAQKKREARGRAAAKKRAAGKRMRQVNRHWGPNEFKQEHNPNAGEGAYQIDPPQDLCAMLLRKVCELVGKANQVWNAAEPGVVDSCFRYCVNTPEAIQLRDDTAREVLRRYCSSGNAQMGMGAAAYAVGVIVASGTMAAGVGAAALLLQGVCTYAY